MYVLQVVGSERQSLICFFLDGICPDFLKVVSTTYNLLSGETVNSHQYSVTQFERDLTQGNAPGKDGHGRKTIFPILLAYYAYIERRLDS